MSKCIDEEQMKNKVGMRIDERVKEGVCWMEIKRQSRQDGE